MWWLEKEAVNKAKEDLISQIKESAISYGNFILSSGKESNYFIDASKITLSSIGLSNIIRLIYWDIRDDDNPLDDFTCVGGPVLGADPIVGAILYLLDSEGYDNIKGFLIRKEPKNGQIIEGNVPNSEDIVLILEDVITTGKQTIKAIEEVEKFGAQVVAVISVIDRGEGARELIEAKGIQYRPLLTLADLEIKT